MSKLEERWIIKDDKSAEWALEKIREAQEDTARWNAYYAAQMEQIERQNADTVAYFTALLEAWFKTVPHKVTKTQESYQLPGGKLVRKLQQPAYERDVDALLAWAKASFPEAVKVKEEVSWEAVKKRITAVNGFGRAIDRETGELISGVTVTKRDPVFRVELTKEED